MISFDAISAATPDKAGLTAEYAALDRMLDDGDRAGAAVPGMPCGVRSRPGAHWCT